MKQTIEIPTIKRMDLTDKALMSDVAQVVREGSKPNSIQNQFIKLSTEEQQKELNEYYDDFFARLNNLSSEAKVELSQPNNKVLTLRALATDIPTTGTKEFFEMTEDFENACKSVYGKEKYFNFLEVCAMDKEMVIAVEYSPDELKFEEIIAKPLGAPIDFFHRSTAPLDDIPFHFYKYYSERLFDNDLELYFFVRSLELNECSCCDEKISENEFTRYKY